MKARVVFTLVLTMLLGVVLSAAAALASEFEATQAAEHCPDHSAIEAAGNKVNANEAKEITVVDQFGDEHQLLVTNEGETVTFELLTEDVELVSVTYCVKGGSTLPTNGGTVTAEDDFSYTHPQDISYTVAYAIEIRVLEPPDGAWCSPGFWKNNPLAVADTGVDMDDLYSAVFGAAPPRLPQGVNAGAPEEPTLQQVLDNLSWYGGEAFNDVGDLLSAEHPDVDFVLGDERVEDSCPLSADASRK